MIINDPILIEKENCIEYNFTVILPAEETKKEVFVQVDKKFLDLVSDFSDAALLIMLLPAMVDNHDIIVKGKLSEQLYNNLASLQELIIRVIPWCRKINVQSDTIVPSSNVVKENVITGFSAGVDAFVTLNDYYLNPKSDNKITHLLFNNLIYSDNVAEDKFKHISKFANEVSLPIIQTRTNFHDLYAKKKIGFEQTHPIRNAVIAHILSKQGLTFLYSSSFPKADFEIKPWPDIAIANQALLPLLSTDKVKIVESGAEYGRVEKTEIVSKIPYTYEYLDICIGKKHLKSDFYNCSQCYKCMRALVTFEKLEVINKYHKLFDLTLYREKRNNYLKKLRKSKQLNDVNLLEFLAENKHANSK